MFTISENSDTRYHHKHRTVHHVDFKRALCSNPPERKENKRMDDVITQMKNHCLTAWHLSSASHASASNKWIAHILDCTTKHNYQLVVLRVMILYCTADLASGESMKPIIPALHWYTFTVVMWHLAGIGAIFPIHGTKRKIMWSILLVGLQIQHVSNSVCGTVVEKTMPTSEMGGEQKAQMEKKPLRKVNICIYAQIDGSDQAILAMNAPQHVWQANSTQNVLFRNLFNEPNRSGWVVSEQRKLSVHHKIWKRQRCLYKYVFTKMLTISLLLCWPFFVAKIVLLRYPSGWFVKPSIIDSLKSSNGQRKCISKRN